MPAVATLHTNAMNAGFIAGRIVVLRSLLRSGSPSDSFREELVESIQGWRESLALLLGTEEADPAREFDLGGEG